MDSLLVNHCYVALKKVIIKFNELSLNCYPLCILIHVNIKKLNLLKNNNPLENNGKKYM